MWQARGLRSVTIVTFGYQRVLVFRTGMVYYSAVVGDKTRTGMERQKSCVDMRATAIRAMVAVPGMSPTEAHRVVGRGTIMQVKPRAGSVITHRWDEENPNLLTFVVAGAGEITLDLSKASRENLARFARHGALQRVNDAAAKSRGAADGKPASPEAKLAAMQRLVDHYNSGAETWGPEREDRGPGLNLTLIAAVAEATKRTPEEVRALVETGAVRAGLSQKAYLEQLGTSKKVKDIYARMTAEKHDLDADAELAAMMRGAAPAPNPTAATTH